MKTPSKLAALLAVVPLLLSAGCVLESGVGDPAKAKVDSKWTGYWLNEADGQLATIVAYDESTYLVDWMAYKGTAAAPEPALRVLNKGWTAEVGGKTYATFDMLIPKLQQRQQFLVVELDLNGDSVTMRQLNPRFAPFASARTSKQLEAAIKKHRDDKEAFSAKHVFKKTTADDTHAIRRAFHSG